MAEHLGTARRRPTRVCSERAEPLPLTRALERVGKGLNTLERLENFGVFSAKGRVPFRESPRIPNTLLSGLCASVAKTDVKEQRGESFRFPPSFKIQNSTFTIHFT